MAKAWYPVIDYNVCEECGTCVKKCPRGVYEKTKAPTPVVANPISCIDGCHGCGNLCPQGAITYIGDDTGWKPPNGILSEEPDACSCCSDEKKIKIDFLFLDLNTCERCITTDSALNEAVDEISGVLKTLGFDIIVNKVNITSPELAEQYHFLSSPTIRVNGRDICTEVKENNCKNCGDLCGDDVNCRVFVYNGAEYNQPPKAMIMDGILKAVYTTQDSVRDSFYTLPENLNTFFTGKKNSCCDGECTCQEGCE